jgi:hypothetical protein
MRRSPRHARVLATKWQRIESREAERLARLCRADAIRAGITVYDLLGWPGAILVAFMREALDAADIRDA